MDKYTEEEILKFWEENRIYEKAKERRKDGKPFFFMDGPPYATGSIHLGTAWNKILKDAFIRYFRMRGYDVYDRPGYDTHGLPIENKVEKELGISTKEEIEEKVGIEEFVKRCKEFATRHVDSMTEQFKNLGVWMDWDNAYLTLTDEYIETGWWTFNRAKERGLLYRGRYPLHVCPHCQTSLSFNEVEYTEREDPSIYVAFPSEEGYYFLVWTTTPWTLPSNVALMVDPREDYVFVEVGGKTYVLAEKRLEDVAREVGWEDFKVVKRVKGEELVGKRYLPVIDIELQRFEHRVVPSERFVSMEEGTGIVHTAPGHGREDFLVGREHGLPVLSPVGMDGRYTEEAGKYAGMFVLDANSVIIEELREKGYLVYEGKIKHRYPICWRCKSPLLFMAVEEWFYRVDPILDTIREEAEKVYWYPKWAGDRFRNWLDNLHDWPVSRRRYWGIPIPLWICDRCGKQESVSSKEELKKKAGYLPEDLHRPWIDRVTWKCECGGTMRRVPDVFDVWFDSGITTWAVLGYPRNRELFERYWPADLEVEGVDQIRGWWNSQMIASVIVFDKAPYKRITMHGFVLDVHGVKMSKSLGNFVSPEEIIEKYSRDVLRYYFLQQPLGEDINFDWEKVKEAYRDLNIIENLYTFLERVLLVEGVHPYHDDTSHREPEDIWIVSRLNSVMEEYHEHMEALRVNKALRAVSSFLINEVSRVYVKVVRDRIKSQGRSPRKLAAIATLYRVLRDTLLLLSPFVPFLTERMYQKMFRKYEREESVHLFDIPLPRKGEKKEEMEKYMETVLEAAEAVNALRNELGIKLRWPIKEVVVEGEFEAFRVFRNAFLSLVNAKDVKEGSREDYAVREFAGGRVCIPRELDGELMREALAREVLRRVQGMRKEMGLIEKDHVIMELWGDEELVEAVRGFEELFKERAQVDEILYSDGTLDGYTKEFSVEGYYLKVTLRKV